MRVLVTRPKEDSAALHKELAQRGIHMLSDPMLVIRHREDAAADLTSVRGLLFTSSNGVRAFAAKYAARDLAAWCVGDETARTARSEGFAKVHSAAGNVETLADYVIAHARPEDGRLLHVAGSVTAGDLAGLLRAAGFAVDRVPMYEAVAATALSAETQKAFLGGDMDAALFFSPRTATTFVSLANEAGLGDACRTLDAFCLSEAVARTVADLPWRRVIVAEEPSRAAMLAALDQRQNHTA